MSELTYNASGRRPLVLLGGEIKTPPMSREARREVGIAIRRLQRGETLSLPLSRPMSDIGPGCHELRIEDADRRQTWRLPYFVEPDAVVILDVFAKKTRATPRPIIERCQRRLARYLRDVGEKEL